MKNRKNKILMATGTFRPEVSGQANFVFRFIKGLPDDDFDKIIVSYGNEKSLDKNVYIIRRNIWRYLNYFVKLRQLNKEADIIYAQDLISSGLPASLAKRKNNKMIVRLGGDFLWEKMVNSGYTQVPLSRYYDQPKNWPEKIYLLIYKFVLRRCDKIIFNTLWQSELYQKVFNLPAKKTAVIENPVSVGSEKISRVNKISGDEIIYAGRFSPLKNLPRLIKAFKKVKTDKKLVLIGAGPEKQRLEKISANDGRIKILDKMDQTVLWRRLAKCYLFVLPSLFDVSPNSALEVLSLGRPVLLTRENGLPQDIKNRFKLIDPLSVESIKNGLEYFLNQDNYGKYLPAGKILSRHWEEVIKEHLLLFKDLEL